MALIFEGQENVGNLCIAQNLFNVEMRFMIHNMDIWVFAKFLIFAGEYRQLRAIVNWVTLINNQ